MQKEILLKRRQREEGPNSEAQKLKNFKRKMMKNQIESEQNLLEKQRLVNEKMA